MRSSGDDKNGNAQSPEGIEDKHHEDDGMGITETTLKLLEIDGNADEKRMTVAKEDARRR